MKEFLRLYKKFGGKRLLYQWFRARVLLFALFHVLRHGISRKTLEILRLSIQYKIHSRLRNRYKDVIYSNEAKSYTSLDRKHSNKVWVCWFQGIDSAPKLVQKCFQSLKANLKDKDIIVLDTENISEYVQFPEYIMRKFKKGIISNTHLSDLLRVEVLIKHGGTWIDSTVLCTGGEIPSYIFDSDLFLYQMLKPGLDGHSINISSWFISSTSNNSVLVLTRDLLYAYWKDNNFLIDYFLLHHFIVLSLERYPQERDQIPKIPNSIPHILLLQLFEPFDEKAFDFIKDLTSFHKLSYKFSSEEIERSDTFYDIIVNNKI